MEFKPVTSSTVLQSESIPTGFPKVLRPWNRPVAVLLLAGIIQHWFQMDLLENGYGIPWSRSYQRTEWEASWLQSCCHLRPFSSISDSPPANEICIKELHHKLGAQSLSAEGRSERVVLQVQVKEQELLVLLRQLQCLSQSASIEEGMTGSILLLESGEKCPFLRDWNQVFLRGMSREVYRDGLVSSGPYSHQVHPMAHCSQEFSDHSPGQAYHSLDYPTAGGPTWASGIFPPWRRHSPELSIHSWNHNKEIVYKIRLRKINYTIPFALADRLQRT